MKKFILLSTLTLAILPLSGCVGPDWKSMASENKSYDIYVRSIYGTVEVHSRLPGDTSTNAPLIIDGGSIPPGSVLQLRAR